MTDGVGSEAYFPAVVIKIKGVTCRALIDSGAGSTYASSMLIDTHKLKPSETKVQRVDMLISTRTAHMGI